jgi:hypothetical protein
MIQENSFRMNWNNNFPSALTYGLQLRDQYKEHWLRIHTLPNSKRYPDKSNHYKEILKRHDELMNDLFKPNSTLAVVTFGYSETCIPVKPKEMDFISKDLSYLYSTPYEIDEENPTFNIYWHGWFYFEQVTEKKFDVILHKVIDNAIQNVYFVDPLCKNIYHPYDGGADIIFSENQNVKIWKEKYNDWLPNNSIGL